MYNREKLALFCDYCTRYPEQGKSLPFIFSDDSPGFKNWKKGVERTEEHRKCHLKAAMAGGTGSKWTRVTLGDGPLDQKVGGHVEENPDQQLLQGNN